MDTVTEDLLTAAEEVFVFGTALGIREAIRFVEALENGDFTEAQQESGFSDAVGEAATEARYHSLESDEYLDRVCDGPKVSYEAGPLMAATDAIRDAGRRQGHLDIVKALRTEFDDNVYDEDEDNDDEDGRAQEFAGWVWTQQQVCDRFGIDSSLVRS